MKRALLTAAALVGIVFPAARAAADEAPSSPTPASGAASDRVVFEAAYFAEFSPQTAYDMVSRTPGFSIDDGSGRRGFSGAVGNVLIDGVRPAAKNQSLSAILGRIPAGQVLRIEVLRGADTAGDASGQSVIANVVRTPSAGDGVWEVGFEETARNRPAPNVDLSWSGRRGTVDYGLGASYFGTFRSQVGDRRFTDENEVTTRLRHTASPRHYEEYSTSGNLATPLAGGRLSFNGEVSGFRFHAVTFGPTENPDGSKRADDNSRYEEERIAYELGANYLRNIAGWEGELVGLLNRARYTEGEHLVHTEYNPASASEFVTAVGRDSGESILRASINRNFATTQHIEFGVEGAINTLDAKLNLLEDDGAGFMPVVIPNGNVSVEEKRAEAYLAHSWRFHPRWSLETRLAEESSTLTFTGDTNKSVELAYFKPSFQITRDIGSRSQLRAHLYRDVGQLNFDDFVSAAAISDGRINGGNPDLRPETSWRAELTADIRLDGDFSLSLTYLHAFIDDASDVVPVTFPGANPGDPPIRFDAPGNIGEADVDRFNINLTLPLKKFIPGARFTLDTTLRNSRVSDPLTGMERSLSDRPEVETELEFRQDLTQHKWAWGISSYQQRESSAYRLAEIVNYEEGPWVDLFFESTAFTGLKLRATLANMFDGRIKRERLFFDPDRNGDFVGAERYGREFERGPWINVRLSGNF